MIEVGRGARLTPGAESGRGWERAMVGGSLVVVCWVSGLVWDGRVVDSRGGVEDRSRLGVRTVRLEIVWRGSI